MNSSKSITLKTSKTAKLTDFSQNSIEFCEKERVFTQKAKLEFY